MKKYSKKNNWYKFYNNKGDSCRIKIKAEISNSFVIIKFKYEEDVEWLYHSPNKKFRNCQDIIWYITNNLEKNKMLFEVNSSKGL